MALSIGQKVQEAFTVACGEVLTKIFNLTPTQKTAVKASLIAAAVALVLAVALPILAKYGYLQMAFQGMKSTMFPFLNQHVFSPIASAMTSNVPGWVLATATAGGLIIGSLTIYGVSHARQLREAFSFNNLVAL
jgi:lysylphosphatidylglycerol synthetase-like protein (DUF2156 family)